MGLSERRWTVTLDNEGEPRDIGYGPTAAEQRNGWTAVEVVAVVERSKLECDCGMPHLGGAEHADVSERKGSFTIRWDATFGEHGGYRVSIPNLDPNGEGVEVIPASEVVGASEHRWTIYICADCGEHQHDHNRDECWKCGSGRDWEEVEVVPAGEGT